MITIIEGDLFETDAKIICHQVNCQGKMGSGVALQVKQRYPNVYKEYIEYCENTKNLLGTVLKASTNINSAGNPCVQMVYNLFAQETYGYDGKCYTSYEALQKCFDEIADKCKGETIAMPYLMGCYRGGGDWSKVYKMIEDTFIDCNIILYKRGTR